MAGLLDNRRIEAISGNPRFGASLIAVPHSARADQNTDCGALWSGGVDHWVDEADPQYMQDRQLLRSGSAPRILVCVDGSEDSLSALEYAIGDAETSGAALWLVHVAEAGDTDVSHQPDGARGVPVRQHGEEVLAEAMGTVTAAGFPVDRTHSELAVGQPCATLVTLSAEALEVVMGRTSFTGLTHAFVGDTTLQVAARAPRPVVVVSAAHLRGRRTRPVAAAIGLGEASDSTLEFAFKEAGSRAAHLILVYFPAEVLRKSGPALVAEGDVSLEAHLAPLRARYPATVVTVETPEVAPLDALVAASRTAGLLILGRARMESTPAGSVRGVLAHARCPVLVIG